VADLQSELETAQRDSRDHAAEVYRQRSAIDDSNDVIESLKRENKNLAGMSVGRIDVVVFVVSTYFAHIAPLRLTSSSQWLKITGRGGTVDAGLGPCLWL